MSVGALDGDEVLIASTGHLYVADVTASLPTGVDTALGPDWFDVGYTTEDGVSLGLERDVKSIMPWQVKRPVRKFNASQAESLKCDLLQWNAETIVLAFGGGSVSGSAGAYRYDFPDPEETPEHAFVLDWLDGPRGYRMVVPKGTVTEKVEVKLTRTDAAALPIQIDVIDLAPYMFSNDTALAPSS